MDPRAISITLITNTIAFHQSFRLSTEIKKTRALPLMMHDGNLTINKLNLTLILIIIKPSNNITKQAMLW